MIGWLVNKFDLKSLSHLYKIIGAIWQLHFWQMIQIDTQQLISLILDVKSEKRNFNAKIILGQDDFKDIYRVLK